MFHLKLLQCAVALADQRHFRKAAEVVRITQSGFTQSIQRLEEHYGELLFVRDRQGVSPTQFGEIVVAGARVILERVASMEREITLTSNLTNGELVIGADPLLVHSILAPALAVLLESHPGLSISVRTEIPQELNELLERRELDLFVSYPISKTNPAADLRMFSIPAPVVVCATTHPLANKGAPNINEIFQYPRMGGTLPEWYFDWVDKHVSPDYPASRSRDTLSLQINDVSLLKNLTASSTAIMALMKSELEPELDRGELVELPVPNWPKTVPVVIGVPAGSVMSIAAQRLQEEIITTIESL